MSTTICYRPAVAFVAMLCVASQAIAADHRDGPRVTDSATTLGALDLNDLYVFVSPANKNHSVLILTTGGLDVGLIGPATFSPGAVYELRVSNDGVDINDEIVFQFVFSNPDRFGRQNYTVRQVLRKRTSWNNPLLARGVTGQQVNGSLGIKVQAGVFDDPFFFNLAAFQQFRTNTQQGIPLPQRAAPFLPPNPAVNGFRKNTLAIVLELPRVQLVTNPNRPNITAWIRVLTPDGKQFDRMGNPAINTAVGFGFQGNDNIQDLFNSLTPADDIGLRTEAARRINLIFGLPLTGPVATGGPNATQLAGALLPDVIRFDTTSTTGFLNGRRLTDDVIDAELNLLTGGVLTTDRVDLDSVFLDRFPYLAAAIPPQ